VDKDKTNKKVWYFFRDRMSGLLVEEGASKDIVAAATAISFDNPGELWRRTFALEKLKSMADYEALAAAFKRVVRIILQAKDKNEDMGDAVNPALFEEDSEKALYQTFVDIKEKAANLNNNGQVEEALVAISGLRPHVDLFFDEVMVMAENPEIRKNRLALLNEIAELFAIFADFSKIS